jgi:hypothetical protein
MPPRNEWVSLGAVQEDGAMKTLATILLSAVVAASVWAFLGQSTRTQAQPSPVSIPFSITIPASHQLLPIYTVPPTQRIRITSAQEVTFSLCPDLVVALFVAIPGSNIPRGRTHQYACSFRTPGGPVPQNFAFTEPGAVFWPGETIGVQLQGNPPLAGQVVISGWIESHPW